MRHNKSDHTVPDGQDATAGPARWHEGATRPASDVGLRLPSIAPDRYEIEGEQGRGGIGLVLRARDRHLDRLVAIKRLQRDDPDARDRFEREMLVTARLQHPGVVPVHEVGCLPSGEPFYSMKLIEGRSLRELCADASTLEARLALVPHVIAVAEAVAYAHSRGVVHRDLKPANVIVGAFGETVVIDWGMAKVLGETEAATTSSALHHAVVADGLTATGAVLGTPAYMAPEQARGEDVDERADVWALGAMLYHVLTGQPPYHGESSDVLARVIAGTTPQPLERVAPAVPRELAAIVASALRIDRAARYPSAAEMAADLKRFATGQLVHAYHYGVATLVRRWVAQHRAAVITAALLLTLLVVGGALSVRSIVSEKERADRLARVATAERTEAVTQREGAEALVAFLVDNQMKRLGEVGRLDLLSDVGKRIEDYYDRVDPTRTRSDATTLGRFASLYFQLAEVARARLDVAAEVAAAETSLDLRRRQLALAPGDREVQKRAAAVYTFIAMSERRRGGEDASLQATKQAREILDRLLAETPDDQETRILLADVDVHGADLDSDRGDLEAAQAGYQRYLDVMRSAAAADPTNDQRQSDLGDGWFYLGQVLTNRNMLPQAEAAYRESVSIRRHLADRNPDDTVRGSKVAITLFRLGDVQQTLGDVPSGLATLQAAREIQASLVARDPDHKDHQRSLSMTLSAICRTLATVGRTEEALGYCQQGLTIGEALVAAAPEDAIAARSLCRRYLTQAELELHLDRLDDSLRHARACLALTDRGLEQQPGDNSWEYERFTALLAAARAEVPRGADRAAVHVEAARVLIPELKADTAVRWVPRLDIIAGDIARAQGRSDAARQAYRAGLDGFEPLVQAGKVARPQQLLMATAYVDLSTLVPPAQRPALLARARQIIVDATKGSKPTPDEQRLLRRVRAGR